jgi:hypothetical protein
MAIELIFKRLADLSHLSRARVLVSKLRGWRHRTIRIG